MTCAPFRRFSTMTSTLGSRLKPQSPPNPCPEERRRTPSALKLPICKNASPHLLQNSKPKRKKSHEHAKRNTLGKIIRATRGGSEVPSGSRTLKHPHRPMLATRRLRLDLKTMPSRQNSLSDTCLKRRKSCAPTALQAVKLLAPQVNKNSRPLSANSKPQIRRAIENSPKWNTLSPKLPCRAVFVLPPLPAA